MLAHAVVVGVILALAATARAGDETCEPTPETIWHPAGVEGCTLDGPTDGIASTYPGEFAAANWCSWTLRHSVGCGTWTVQSLTTGVTITVAPGEFCHCYTGTPDERLIDLTPEQVAALGLDVRDGLFAVTVTPLEVADEVAAPVVRLPDTAVAP
ncbi:MAG: hypothetical protein H0W41_02570 [Chloroflexi bacterium]|nr:hypothetical protein [Chloroflexota bacterium]